MLCLPSAGHRTPCPPRFAGGAELGQAGLSQPLLLEGARSRWPFRPARGTCAFRARAPRMLPFAPTCLEAPRKRNMPRVEPVSELWPSALHLRLSEPLRRDVLEEVVKVFRQDESVQDIFFRSH